jgi:CheY-like chemotaxis protein
MKGPGKTILVIDDDRYARAFAQAVLQQVGYIVVEAASAGEGLAVIGSMRIDLVLLDFAMPDRSGLDVLMAMRDVPVSGRPPVIVLSAWGSPDVRRDIEREGASWLAKPIDAATLRKAVDDRVAS